MADIFRTPLIARPENIPSERPVLDDCGSLLCTTLAPAATDPPFVPVLEDTPRRPSQRPSCEREGSSALFLGVLTALPFRNYETVPPTFARRYEVDPNNVDRGTWINSICTDGVPSHGTFIRSGPASATFIEPDTLTSTMAGSATFEQTAGASATFIVRAC